MPRTRHCSKCNHTPNIDHEGYEYCSQCGYVSIYTRTWPDWAETYPAGNYELQTFEEACADEVSF